MNTPNETIVPEQSLEAGKEARSDRPREEAAWLRRARVILKYWRRRVAGAVLLPELSPGEARKLRAAVRDEAELSHGYVLMCGLSAGIATLGLLQSSTAVVIGAMLISPLMSPIAALGFGFASIDGARIRDAARVVMIGAAIGILTGMVITWISPIRNATPEILARTQPTLLDLAVALFSGMAGGYATVIGRGGTAIGVAIATALMPPLATLGYSLGMLNFSFAFGALLLFLTNLAAIAFAFALVARLSNAARPLRRVEMTPRTIVVLVAAVLALATPLSMTLLRLSHEANMRSAARQAILASTDPDRARIAQLDASWPLIGEPSVQALVISPNYAPDAEARAELRLKDAIGRNVDISLQQVLAANVPEQTRALVDAAMERTIAGVAADNLPVDQIRSRLGLPVMSMWASRTQHVAHVEPVPLRGWKLADYRDAESLANPKGEAWRIRVVPPAQSDMMVRLPLPVAPAPSDDRAAAARNAPPPEYPEAAIPVDLAVWALHRWGARSVNLELPEGQDGASLRSALAEGGIAVVGPQAGAETDEARATSPGRRPERRKANGLAPVATLSIAIPTPAEAAERRAAKAAAEAEAAATRPQTATPR